MQQPNIAAPKRRLPTPRRSVLDLPASDFVVSSAAASRVEHGANGWSPSPAARLRQPQDGALGEVFLADLQQDLSQRSLSIERGFGEPRFGEPQSGKPQSMGARFAEPPSAEPEDARLTGGTRSLMRRLMGLNITLSSAKVQPDKFEPVSIKLAPLSRRTPKIRPQVA